MMDPELKARAIANGWIDENERPTAKFQQDADDLLALPLEFWGPSPLRYLSFGALLTAAETAFDSTGISGRSIVDVPGEKP
jgi:hypothetical protein